MASKAKNSRLHKIMQRDGWICGICDGQIAEGQSWKGTHPRDPSSDHIIPQSWGGTWAMWNMRASHRECNGKRGLIMGEREQTALAKNFHIIMGGSEEDRLAAAKQTIEAYREYAHLLATVKGSIPKAMIPPIVLSIRQGRFPWG